jgi:predicted 3-demethylubiquinone-9 3-methyltransferase (glyoxalase superfamily)
MNNEISLCLWFDGQAKEAAEFYCSVFENSKIISENPMMVTFDLNGRKLMGLNGGPQFKFNEAASLFISCENQAEIDYYWVRLTEGGEEGMCGWLKDKFGLSWQIVPSILGKLMYDPEKSTQVVQAFLQMKKINIQILLNA